MRDEAGRLGRFQVSIITLLTDNDEKMSKLLLPRSLKVAAKLVS